MKFANSQKSGLGIPLPAGKVRVFKADVDGSLEFLGEDEIDHTPRDEEVKLYVGDAFDVVVTREQKDFNKIGDRVFVETYDISIANHKDADITVVVDRAHLRRVDHKELHASLQEDQVGHGGVRGPGGGQLEGHTHLHGEARGVMEGIGERLKRRREELGLSREAAAEATKFQPDLIEAVEEGRAGVFSAKVYHLAFIRAYARMLELDADQLIRDQKSEERAQEALKGIRTIPPKSRNLRRTLITAGAVVALAVAALVISNRVFQARRGEAGKPSGSGSSTRVRPLARSACPRGRPK